MILRQLVTDGRFPWLAHYFGFRLTDVYTHSLEHINALLKALPAQREG